MKTILILLLGVTTCYAQLDPNAFEVSTVRATIGLNKPIIVGNGVVYATDSKPQQVIAGVIISQVESESVEVWAFGNGEFGDVQQIDSKRWILYGAGKYQVILQVFEGGRSRKSSPKTITLGEVPVDPDVPTPEPTENLSQLSKDARVIMRAYVQEMADDMEKLATNAKNGKYAKVADASTAMNLFDATTRTKFKSRIGEQMAPRLGQDALPKDASKVFTDISIGYRGIK